MTKLKGHRECYFFCGWKRLCWKTKAVYMLMLHCSDRPRELWLLEPDRLWPAAQFTQHLDVGLMSFTLPLVILLSDFYEGIVFVYESLSERKLEMFWNRCRIHCEHMEMVLLTTWTILKLIVLAFIDDRGRKCIYCIQKMLMVLCFKIITNSLILNVFAW